MTIDFLFLIVLSYGMYMWGRKCGYKAGKARGYEKSYQSETLMRMEEFMSKHDSK